MIKARKFLVTMVLTFFILAAFIISGFTVATVDTPTDQVHTPDQGLGLHSVQHRSLQVNPDSPGDIYFAAPGSGGEEGDQQGEEAPPSDEPVNLIKNGDFEKPWENNDGVAPDWEGYRNGQAWASWYQETWPEAVRSGKQAQLMEIFQVEPNILDRVIAIYQTVEVVPDSKYDLTIYAIMRSQTLQADRNKFEFEMNWGVDYLGEGNYDNVENWVYMDLTEQYRLGSTGEYPEDIPLKYEIVTGTIYTTGTNRITLFIRGWKKFPTGTEVNFDVDDISLVGPSPAAPKPPTPTATAPAVIITPTMNMPTSGANLTKSVSGGVVALGGLVLVILGAGAVAGLLHQRKE